MRIEIEDVSWFDLKREMEIEKPDGNGGHNEGLAAEKTTDSWQAIPLTGTAAVADNVKEYLSHVEEEKPSTAAWNKQENDSDSRQQATTIAKTEVQEQFGESPGKVTIMWAENVAEMEKILKDYMQSTNNRFTSWKTTKGFLKKSKYHFKTSHLEFQIRTPPPYRMDFSFLTI